MPLNDWVSKGTNEKQPYIYDVSEGRFEGVKTNRKYGRTTTVTTPQTNRFDVWEGGSFPAALNGTPYPWDNANAPMYICSSSAADTNILIRYVRNYSDGTFVDLGPEVDEYVTLQGQTVIQLPDCLNITRAFNATTELPLAQHKTISGTVYIFRGGAATNGVPNNATDIRNVILDGSNKTQCACYAIPQGYIAEIVKGEAGIVNTPSGFFSTPVGAKLALRVIQRGSIVSRLEKGVALMSNGNSHYSDVLGFPQLIPAGAKISISVEELTDDARFIGEFVVLLKSENLISTAKLIEIGQPGYTG